MNGSLNPTAVYDSLSLTLRLQRHGEWVSSAEVHAFSYLACVLALYEGHPAADWGYAFGATSVVSPYSTELESAIQSLQGRGYIEQSSQLMRLSARGRAEHDLLASLRGNAAREKYLEPATATVLILPVVAVRHAIGLDPDIQSARQFATSRRLLAKPTTYGMYAHLRNLRTAIGAGVEDLFVTSVTWLQFLLASEGEPSTTNSEESDGGE